jgi:hypothetical protein
MHTVTIRFNDGEFLASLENSDTEGMGETIADALRDLAENIEALQI